MQEALFFCSDEDAPHQTYLKLEGNYHFTMRMLQGTMHHFSGGEVAASNTREYGRANLNFIKENEVFFFEGVSRKQPSLDES
jgi:GMP synthase (glutamine-hydrolysing)